MSTTAQPAPVAADPIPLVDLPAQYQSIQAEVEFAMRRVVERGEFTLGTAVAEFEAAFARYCGVPHCVGVASGTDALFLTLRALGVGPGDEVIVPAVTFAATAEAVVYCGATPRFVDVRAADLLIDPAAVAAAVGPRTRGILPVHLYGQVADMQALRSTAEARGLWVLEDAAQAHGASSDGRRAGSFGVAGCFSFYPSKNLGAYGDGGAVVTANPDLADTLRALRHHGQRVPYQHERLGYCSRLDNLQAAVLSAKLPHLDRWNAARGAAAARYDALIGDRLPRVGSQSRAGSVHHVYVVRVPAEQRDRVLQRLKERGIGAALHYPVPLHQVPAFLELGLGGGTLPVAEQAAAEVLSLPLYPEITPAQQARVVAELFSALSGE